MVQRTSSSQGEVAVETKQREIMRCLSDIEAEQGAKILYACESGSRAWGFASPDSDYDVRFLYVRDQDWYLSFDVERRRDVIECPIANEIDCSGWDVRKALHLFLRTNGALLEWLHSPIRYLERGDFAQSLRTLALRCFNPTALCYHYSHMARRNARDHLFGDQVRLKKYFYVLRPLLAIIHIERGLGIPPVNFEQLVDAVAPENLRPGIAKLLVRKRETPELGLGRPIPEISNFIKAELARHGDAFSGRNRPEVSEKETVREQLNEAFRKAIREQSAGLGAPTRA